MPAKPVLLYPSPVLKEHCEPVEDLELLGRVARDLVDTMRELPRCVGLAAPQIGELLRVVVFDVTGHAKATSCSGLVVLADPALVDRAGEDIGREGCSSIPEFTGNVRRAASVVVEGISEAGQRVEIAAAGFEARVIQHELDHLDGILFLDRVVSRRDLFPRRSYG